ncbi:dihydrofolate reductase family protein [Cryptosporangium japonicum]|uniref:Dihydrofolate reductase family protein n=1 Tax=Cryptosporangium japonicum TaxID=80872 RepID=A0ABN0UDY4_9ACTN
MTLVSIGLSVSLDGYVAGPHDGPDNPLGDGGSRLFTWWTAGGEPLGDDPRFAPPARSRPVVAELFDCGAVLTGRRTFDIARGWGGQHPTGAPFFVLTHEPPPRWVGPGTGGTAVTGGIHRALEAARRVAGDRPISITSASVAQQCLAAGLVDELNLNLVPVLLGGGVALFGERPGPTALECTRVVESDGVTHLRYRVDRPG